jgi:sec-independent protein translocase protein TatA
MGGLSIWHLLIVGVVVLLVFGGKGKISDIMGDVAKGIKSFKKGLSDDDEPKVRPPSESMKTLDHQSIAGVEKETETRKVS